MLILAAAAILSTQTTPNPNLDWFRKERLGMFIHWGPVSLKGTEIGWSRGAQVPETEYDCLYQSFNPTQFNAEEWMSLAHQAGFKYVVPTAKHHDGFCLFPSTRSNYNISNSPFKRDIMGEIATAAKRHGITMCTYYSILDWHSPDYGTGSPGGSGKKEHPNMTRHMETVKSELSQLVHDYHVRMIWFDGGWEAPYTRDHSIDLNQYLRTTAPNVLLNNRLEAQKLRPEDPHGDYATPEQQIGAYDTSHPWETCMTLGDQWAFKPHDRYKSKEEIIRVLIQTVTGDGNLLLNVGPDSTGQIIPEQKVLLLDLGAWLKAYGKSIYGTRGGPYRNGDWGGSTRKGKTIYLHILKWKDGTVVLPALPAKIRGIHTLQPGTSVDVQSTSTSLIITTKVTPKNEPTTVQIDIDRNAWDLGTVESPIKGS